MSHQNCSNLIFLTSLALIAGCSASSGTQALFDAAKLIGASGKQSTSSASRLDPSFSYLRVEIDGRESFVARGYIDQMPDGQTEVWYSSQAEVLKLRDGRLAGMLGTEIEWLTVKIKGAPRWGDIREPVSFIRERDESPGYRFGIIELLALKRILPPLATKLKQLNPADLVWFEESVVGGESGLPPSIYALARTNDGRHEVVYSESCLTPKICLSWQRWPVLRQGSQ